MSLSNITFIDIETVMISPYIDTDMNLTGLFYNRNKSEVDKNADYSGDPDATTGEMDLANKKLWNEKAGLYAEFGKIVCISIGKMNAAGTKFYLKAIAGRNEKVLLEQLSEALIKSPGYLCGHNSIEFDFPFLVRRYIVNGLPIPEVLDTFNKKPWDLKLHDTMKMWSGTAWNHRISLELLATILGLPSPKANMTGASVSDIYYGSFEVDSNELPFDKEQAAMVKISEYCNGDVFTLANVFSRMRGLPLIDKSIIEIVA